MNKSRRYTIEERTNNGKTSYRVKYYDKGIRKSSTFHSRTDAESFTNALTTANAMPSNFEVAPADMLQHLKFREVCKQAGITINDGYDVAIKHMLVHKFTDSNITSLTLAEAINTFMKSRDTIKCRPSTIDEYKRYLNWLKQSLSGDYIVDHITHDDLIKLVNERESQSVREHYVVKLRAFFNYLAKEKIIKNNPAENLQVDKIKTDELPPEILTVPETQAVFDALPNDMSITATYALMAFAGVRPEELCPRYKQSRLTWDNINFTNRTITILGTTSKIRKLRVLYDLPNNLWQWLELVPVEERYGNVCKYSQSKMKLLRKEVLSGKCPTIFRHSFATYGYHYLNPLLVVDILGHLRGFKTYADKYKGIADRDTSFAYFAITPPTTQKEAEA